MSFPRIERNDAGWRVTWWISQWDTPESPDRLFDDFDSYRDAKDAVEEYRSERADEARECACEAAYEAERWPE